MWLILISMILCLHICCGTKNQMHDVQSYQKGYSVKTTQNFNIQHGFNSLPQYMDSPSSESTNFRNRRAVAPKSCPKSKPFVRNAFKKCSTATNTCTVQCFGNYKFANGKTSAKLLCNAGEWILKNIPKTNKPACDPICNPPCQNGGNCTEPATCQCPENFKGTRCEMEKERSCSDDPEVQQAQVDCQSNNCKIMCDEGATLPDGSTTMEMTCQNGEWVPTDPQQQFAPICQPMCENGRVYKECSKVSEQSCGSKTEPETSSSSECFEGCFCPDSTAEFDGKCIPIEECPCNVDGKMYEAGSESQKDCNTCKCENGEWKCTDKKCDSNKKNDNKNNRNIKNRNNNINNDNKNNKNNNNNKNQGARCEIFGDPHYITFDGKRYDFMGKCAYYLMRMNNGMDIIAENGDCPWGNNKDVSCIKSLMLQIPYNYFIKSTIQLKQGGRVEINGVDRTRNLPMNVGGFMTIWPISQMGRQIVCNDGLQIMWDGYTYAHIDAPASHSNQTNGLCGNFDGTPENDFTTPDGDVEVLPETFGDKWRVKEMCKNENGRNDMPPHPCQSNAQNHQQAVEVCDLLKSNLFAACHSFVDPEPYHQNCMYDMCACKGDAQCKCTIFSAYSNECSRRGKIIDWRPAVKECVVECPDDQIYDECLDLCHLSCFDIQSPIQNCDLRCVQGCRCPNGKVLDENSQCVPVEMCFKPTEPNERTTATEPNQAADPIETTEPIEPTDPNDIMTPTKKPEPKNKMGPTAEKNQTSLPKKKPESTNKMESKKPIKPTQAAKPTKPMQITSPTLIRKPMDITERTTERIEETTDDTDVMMITSTQPMDMIYSPQTTENFNPTEKDNDNPPQCENNGRNYINGDHVENDGCNDCICQDSEWYCKNRCKKNGKDDRQNDNPDNQNEQDSNIDPNKNIDENPSKSSLKKPRNYQLQPNSNCQSISLSKAETIGIIEIRDQSGRCVNTEPITGFAECSGLCKSKTTFNRYTSKHESSWECCSITKYENVPVLLICEDGSKRRAIVPMPKSCSCSASCGVEDNNERNYFRNRQPIGTGRSPNLNDPNLNNALVWLLNGGSPPNGQRTFKLHFN